MRIHNTEPYITVPGKYVGKCKYNSIDQDMHPVKIFLIIVDQICSPYLFFSELKNPLIVNYTISYKKEQSCFSNNFIIFVKFLTIL